jgi:hypothetical protein
MSWELNTPEPYPVLCFGWQDEVTGFSLQVKGLCSAMYSGLSLPEVFKLHKRDLHVHIAKVFCLFCFHDIHSDLSLLPLPYNYVNNLPPCIKNSKGFTGINLSQGPTTGNVDALTSNYMLHGQVTPSVHCEVFLHWIEQYYKDIPILQARIRSLTNHNELLIKENHDLKENEYRQAKHLKKTATS